MHSLKNIFNNRLMVLGLSFGLSVSAIAMPSSYFEQTKVLAEKGYSNSQSALGYLYSDGEGVRQDYTQGFYWHRKSADQGNQFGQFSVGYHYLNGQGVRQDYAKALEWFHKAADQGNADAQAIIGDMYSLGQGVRQNKSTGKEWFGESCDNGSQIGCDAYKRLNQQGY